MHPTAIASFTSRTISRLSSKCELFPQLAAINEHCVTAACVDRRGFCDLSRRATVHDTAVVDSPIWTVPRKGVILSEVAGKQLWIAIAFAVMTILPSQAATPLLATLVDTVVRNGPDSQLPAHLSVVLGVSHVEQKTAVKQAVVRDGPAIRTFNVCAGSHDDVVILTYNEQSRATKAYLVSAAGRLRKAVDYQAGEAAHERSLADARSDFAAEIKFWTDFAPHPAP